MKKLIIALMIAGVSFVAVGAFANSSDASPSVGHWCLPWSC